MREYLFVLLVAMVATYVAVPAAYRLAVRVGAFTQVRDRDVHAVPIPRLGGVAVFVGFLAATLVATKLPYLRAVFDTPEIWGVLLGGAIVCAVGAIDDVVELDALTKFAGQIIAAGLMAFLGVQLFSIPVFGVTTVLPAPLLVLLTIFTVVVATNAVNFIDGLDGLASGVVAIAALTFFAYSYSISRTFDPPNVFSSATFVSAALAGCCLGFLPHNFYPARLFMGDSGALLLGLLLAAAMISTTGISPAQVSANAVKASVLPCSSPRGSCCCPCSMCCSRSSAALAPVGTRGARTPNISTTECCGSVTATDGPCSCCGCGPRSRRWAASPTSSSRPAGRPPSSPACSCWPSG